MIARPPVWHCGECGAEGTAPTAKERRAQFEKHWIDEHQEVPWE